MIALIQRVTEAAVRVDGEVVGQIGRGLLIFLGVQAGDTRAEAERLSHKALSYRVFEDDAGRMNGSLLDLQGEALVVSQFTLAADTRKGLRPSFSSGAPPDMAQQRYEEFLDAIRARLGTVQSGRFGTDMKVSLINDGPVTFWLEVSSGG